MFEKAQVLLVEDNDELAGSVADYLIALGYDVDFAYNGAAGLQLLEKNRYDLAIFDVAMPKMNGLDLCRKLRNELFSPIPVIFLTARDTLDDKKLGFQAGADDYLVKPFALEELHLRLQALLSRGPRRDVGIQNIAGLTIDHNQSLVCCNGNQVRLLSLQMNILTILLKHYPNVVSRQTLEQAIWDGTPPESDPLRTHIYRLRATLEMAFDKTIIRTVYAKGYQIV
ncbi:response regulator transcription factor [Shewanella eurypsychrophilus]|uniref:Response regulator transcription factor n=1 Tax=Shewanella eurypsychrophilus TaxID=2593656 RepID=A0ABX6V511_9GAMM|nr:MULTISPECIES: response regulator transcription factor [Shewanella]QFU22192.1 response regulator [Shewanella sp. YLB-09]QPG57478.1 response regulator transcription factor [Shewanella eurypsychrophilus]